MGEIAASTVHRALTWFGMPRLADLGGATGQSLHATIRRYERCETASACWFRAHTLITAGIATNAPSPTHRDRTQSRLPNGCTYNHRRGLTALRGLVPEPRTDCSGQYAYDTGSPARPP